MLACGQGQHGKSRRTNEKKRRRKKKKHGRSCLTIRLEKIKSRKKKTQTLESRDSIKLKK